MRHYRGDRRRSFMKSLLPMAPQPSDPRSTGGEHERSARSSLRSAASAQICAGSLDARNSASHQGGIGIRTPVQIATVMASPTRPPVAARKADSGAARFNISEEAQPILAHNLTNLGLWPTFVFHCSGQIGKIAECTHPRRVHDVAQRTRHPPPISLVMANIFEEGIILEDWVSLIAGTDSEWAAAVKQELGLDLTL
jgi:hypothetical protein